MKRTNYSQKGFTLIEAIFVIIIISILSIVVLTQWPGLTVNLDAQANQLANDLRLTQTLAMTQGQMYCFSISSSSYQIINSATSSAAKLATGSTTATLNKNISFGTLVPSGLKMMVFDSHGTPYSTTTTTCSTANLTKSNVTALSANAQIPLTTSALTKTAVISPDTGRVLVQ